jgi:hypothetical protein
MESCCGGKLCAHNDLMKEAFITITHWQAIATYQVVYKMWVLNVFGISISHLIKSNHGKQKPWKNLMITRFARFNLCFPWSM